MMRGTPAYLSPEQIRLEPATPQVRHLRARDRAVRDADGRAPVPRDVPARRCSIATCTTRCPPSASVRPGAPARRRRRDRAGDREGRRRIASPTRSRSPPAFRAALEGTRVGSRAARRGPEPVQGPARLPRGRRRRLLRTRGASTERLVRRLAEDEPAARFLAVVGPSGSGKSSVVRAGLVPALRRGAIPGSERWFVIEVLPGRHPLRELESALLGVAVEPPPSLLEVLETRRARARPSGRSGAARPGRRAADRRRPARGGLHARRGRGERAHVLESLRAAALEPESRIRVVATLRADFFDAPLSVRGFGELLARADRGDHADGARRSSSARSWPPPIARASSSSHGSLAEMIADVADRPGALAAPAVRAHRARRASATKAC